MGTFVSAAGGGNSEQKGVAAAPLAGRREAGMGTAKRQQGKQRKRGTGGISHRKDGRWEGRYVIGYDERGLPITKNVLAKTKTKCAEKLAALKEQYAKPVEEKNSPNMTFGAWLDLWYQTMKKPAIRPNTQMSYEQRIYGYITPNLGGVALSKLTQGDFQQLYAHLKQRGSKQGAGLSDDTIHGCHATCRAALKDAVKKQLIVRNPTDGCKLPNTTKHEIQTLNAEEIQRLLIQAKENDCYELLLLELSTGLRRGEICALQWDDLNFCNGELRIQRQVHRVKGKLIASEPKTKATVRSILLPPPILRVLSEYKQAASSRWMFPSPKIADAPRDPAAVRKKLGRLLERSGCKHIRFHDLRHTFSTMALANGMDVKTLSTVIGHATTATTLNVYAHTNAEMQRAAAKKIDRGIAKSDAPAEAENAKTPRTTFTAAKGKIRKSGTGCVRQISEHLWEGHYTPTLPDGKRKARLVYAKNEDECEEKLTELIRATKAEIAARKASE